MGEGDTMEIGTVEEDIQCRDDVMEREGMGEGDTMEIATVEEDIQ